MNGQVALRQYPHLFFRCDPHVTYLDISMILRVLSAVQNSLVDQVSCRFQAPSPRDEVHLSAVCFLVVPDRAHLAVLVSSPGIGWNLRLFFGGFAC